MGVLWTEEQKKVIELRDRNLLVSAAAGSGKTAVLVERIIHKITDTKRPVDIDKLLVVTFTNSAAAEMRERVAAALEKKIEEAPEDFGLQRQLTLIHNSQITTIHSFCLYVIRNYFHVIDLEPGFRVADEGELKLLKKDIVKKVLDQAYEAGERSFYNFIEAYSPGKTDDAIEELILQLYHFSMSYPFPKKWLEDCKEIYNLSTMEELEKSPWMESLKDNVKLILSDIKQVIQEGRALSLSKEGPYMYEDAWASDLGLAEKLSEAVSYTDYYQIFEELKFARLSSKKDSSVSEEKRNLSKIMREEEKDALKKLRKQYFTIPPKEILSGIQNSKESVTVLIDLTIEFMNQFSGKKAEKNLADFNDLEHYALNILINQEKDELVPSDVAKELSENFEEIMIDEYQDSNYVQELILTSVSGKNKGKFNLFMVGDVKQSIYRFRLARPELFMEKHEQYSLEDGLCQRIDLHKNFRSRGQVLDGVNYIFERIMRKSLGNIEYDKDAALYKGALFPENDREDLCNTELILVDLDAQVLEEEGEDYTSKEVEARAIAARIKELVSEDSGFRVLDKKTQCYRKAEYKDIVILLRTISGWADIFSNVLMAEGIPVYTGSQTGYFSTIEVKTVLCFLNVIDNPIQDIPLAAVLKSPMVGLLGEELAMIRSAFPTGSLYESCLQYSMIEIKDQELSDSVLEVCHKLNQFFTLLEDFRDLLPHTGIHELLWLLLEKTGYGDYVSAMPGGEQRKANIDMLIEKAVAFESTSYRGLFNFVRYIEYLQKYDVDFGEVGLLGENEDTVRIMSIHKSKGLEFPVVFVSGMGKKFNNRDAASKLVLHPDLGIGVEYIDTELRVKIPTLIKRVIQEQVKLENLGEELRILYVALTRAKEKLIITGSVSKIEKKLNMGLSMVYNSGSRLSFHQISKAGNYLDWMIPAMIHHSSFQKILNEYGIHTSGDSLDSEQKAEYEVRVVTLAELAGREVVKQYTEGLLEDQLLSWDEKRDYDEETKKELEKRLEYTYPYENEAKIHTKITVSELKKIGQHIDEEKSLLLYQEPDPVPLLPEFIKGKSKEGGSVKGSAYHKVLEVLNFSEIDETMDSLEIQLTRFLKEEILTEDMVNLIDKQKIYKFVTSHMGTRMKEAEKRNQLHKEQPFVIGMPAKEIKPEYKSEEIVLIQGIIDVYFEEEDQLVLVDYKTDVIGGKEEEVKEELIKRYHLQLNYYQKALEKLRGKKVKEKMIYSFYLGKEIRYN